MSEGEQSYEIKTVEVNIHDMISSIKHDLCLDYVIPKENMHEDIVCLLEGNTLEFEVRMHVDY